MVSTYVSALLFRLRQSETVASASVLLVLAGTAVPGCRAAAPASMRYSLANGCLSFWRLIWGNGSVSRCSGVVSPESAEVAWRVVKSSGTLGCSAQIVGGSAH